MSMMPPGGHAMLRVADATEMGQSRRDLKEWVPPSSRRRTLFDLSPMLHCSVIGTCLTMGEVRNILKKVLGNNAETLSDHDVHTQGVRLASVKVPSKLLNKALDKKHHIFIQRFEKVTAEQDLRALWSEARRQGRIEGAYWAIVTHPSTSWSCLQHVFGELHMLSHLVGSSNRADIRRLIEFENETASLRATLEKATSAMRAGFSQRDSQIHQLRRALACSANERNDEEPLDGEVHALRRGLAELQQQLDRATARAERYRILVGEGRQRELALQTKLETAEDLGRQLEKDLQSLESFLEATPDEERVSISLANKTFLYVGGKTSLIPKLRALIEHRAGAFLHHDGGQMQSIGLLAGLICRADCVFFPVDFVSHQAMFAVKRQCELSGVRFIALHRCGSGSLVRGIEHFLGTASPQL